MKHKHRILVLRWAVWIFCSLIPHLGVAGEPFVVQPIDDFQLVTSGISVLSGEKQLPPFEQVSSEAYQDRFAQNAEYQLGHKHWVRINLVVPDSLWGEYLLMNVDGWGRSEFYIPRGSHYARAITGYSVPPSERRRKHIGNKSVTAILQGTDTITCYVKLDFAAYEEMTVPIFQIRPFTNSYAYQAQIKSNILWVTVVFLLAISAYHLMIFIFTKDYSYLFYTLSSFLLSPYLITINYRLFDIISLKLSYSFINDFLILTGVLGGISYLYFSINYLKKNDKNLVFTKNKQKIIHILCSITFLFAFISASFKFYPPYSILVALAANLAFTAAVLFMIWQAAIMVRKGSLTAKYYLISALIILPFLLIHLMQITFFRCDCIFNVEIMFDSALNIGILTQSVAFSIALGARISLLREQVNEQMLKVERIEREKLIEVQQLIEAQKNVLEEEVAQRTQSLQEANEELRMSEDNLHQLNQAKDRFFAIISHDLRGPVSSFQGISRVLRYQMKKQNTERVQQLMDEVDQSASQLNVLLDNLLNWAQTQLGGLRYKPQKIPLKSLVEDISEVYAGMAMLKHVDTHIHILPDDLTIWGDLPSISTILRNIWGNALKFTEHGSITLSARPKGKIAHITLADTGIGISQEKLDAIFELSDTKSSIGTFGEKGSGLGLTLCKTFANHNNGNISVESIEGKGTTVYLTLPIYQESQNLSLVSNFKHQNNIF